MKFSEHPTDITRKQGSGHHIGSVSFDNILPCVCGRRHHKSKSKGPFFHKFPPTKRLIYNDEGPQLPGPAYLLEEDPLNKAERCYFFN